MSGRMPSHGARTKSTPLAEGRRIGRSWKWVVEGMLYD